MQSLELFVGSGFKINQYQFKNHLMNLPVYSIKGPENGRIGHLNSLSRVFPRSKQKIYETISFDCRERKFSIKRQCNQQNFKVKKMANRQGNADIQSYPSFLSSSIFQSDISIKNQLSLGINNEDVLNIAFQSFSQIKVGENHPHEKPVHKGSNLEMRKSTSFQEMLMENHRTVLVDTIRQYFSKVQHQFLQTFNSLAFLQGLKQQDNSTTSLQQAEAHIQNILSSNSKLPEANHNRIVGRLFENPDELSIVMDMLKICPKEIEFEVLFLISYLLEGCNEIIQHFKRKNFTRELKDKSLQNATILITMPCLAYLFQSEKVKDVTRHFEVFVEKWMITLFLMKIGVFENELETKSIEDCLKSQVFSKIDLNDLLNQHLIRPSKKPKHKAQ